MHLLWRLTLTLTTEHVAMVTVVMVTWARLAQYWGTITILRAMWGMFTPCISMETGQMQLLGNADHVIIR